MTKTIYTDITMQDGTVLKFAGDRKLHKEAVVVDGKPTLRVGFRNGEQRIYVLPDAMLAQCAAHGLSQKLGDSVATTKDKPLSVEDMVLAMDDTFADINAGKWKEERGTGTGAGAGVVIRALVRYTGKTDVEARAFIEAKMTALGASRSAIYAALRTPNTAIGDLISVIEKEDAAKKAPKVDQGVLMEGLAPAA